MNLDRIKERAINQPDEMLKLAKTPLEYHMYPKEFFEYSFDSVNNVKELLNKKVDNVSKLQRVKHLFPILDPSFHPVNWERNSSTQPKINSDQPLNYIYEKINWLAIHHFAKLIKMIARERSLKAIFNRVDKKFGAAVTDGLYERALALDSGKLLRACVRYVLGGDKEVIVHGTHSRTCPPANHRILLIGLNGALPNPELLKLARENQGKRAWNILSPEQLRGSMGLRFTSKREVKLDTTVFPVKESELDNYFWALPAPGSFTYRSVATLISDLARIVFNIGEVE